MVVKPGETFTIACKITGYSASGGGYTNWIRHSSGKPMEWIGWFHTSSSNGVKDSLKNKISFSSESSSNTVILTGKTFNTELRTQLCIIVLVMHYATNCHRTCSKSKLNIFFSINSSFSYYKVHVFIQ